MSKRKPDEEHTQEKYQKTQDFDSQTSNPASLWGSTSEEPLQKITFVGSGQITAVFVALLVERNRKLGFFDQKVAISVLGREGSESLATWREKGFRVNLKGDGQVIEVKPDEIFCAEDAEEIVIKNGYQDQIFVATKTISHSEKLFDEVNKLKKRDVTPDKGTNIILSQNGIPCWFKMSLKKKPLKEDDPNKIILDKIGVESLVGCVLNFASNVVFDENGNPDYSCYDLATKRDKINVPISSIDSKERDNIASLRSVLLDTGSIKVAPNRSDIRRDVLSKLEVNIIVNGLSAITGKTVGEIMQDDGLKHVMLGLAAEVENIASQAKINQLYKDEEALINRLSQNLHHIPSMGIDFMLGRKLETSSIYGATIEFADSIKSLHPNLVEKLKYIVEEAVSIRDQKISEQVPIPDAVMIAREGVAKHISALIKMAKGLHSVSQISSPRKDEDPKDKMKPKTGSIIARNIYPTGSVTGVSAVHFKTDEMIFTSGSVTGVSAVDFKTDEMIFTSDEEKSDPEESASSNSSGSDQDIIPIETISNKYRIVFKISSPEAVENKVPYAKFLVVKKEDTPSLKSSTIDEQVSDPFAREKEGKGIVRSIIYHVRNFDAENPNKFDEIGLDGKKNVRISGERLSVSNKELTTKFLNWLEKNNIEVSESKSEKSKKVSTGMSRQ